MKCLGKLTLQIIAGANIATIIVMFLVGHSDVFNPVDHPLLATVGLTFPLFLCINLAFTAFWIVFSIKRVIIPFAGNGIHPIIRRFAIPTVIIVSQIIIVCLPIATIRCRISIGKQVHGLLCIGELHVVVRSRRESLLDVEVDVELSFRTFLGSHDNHTICRT